jgi:type 1 glutamine amidotransferase
MSEGGWMSMLRILSIVLFSSLLMLYTCTRTTRKIVIVTGGHDFEREPFFAVFNDMPGLSYQEVSHPAANSLLGTDVYKRCDAVVFYDMNQEISDDQKNAFIQLLKAGKGMVFLHHSLASYQNWPELNKIRGGRYLLAAEEKDGVSIPASTYQHDMEVPVTVVDPRHAVTLGLKDFIIHDEVYGHFSVQPDVTPLLTTTHPESSPIIAWTHRYENSRIIYIQLGHDHLAYENENFRTLIRQAVFWACQNPL